ncbi:MAG TPA: acyl-CoA dehydrogenase family protein [Gaiellaceae bacterium]|nr:acyl-CoA dehydrogenase family protein [Gaiellaceae bacterium]
MTRESTSSLLDLGDLVAAADDVATSVLRVEAEAVDREARWPERGISAVREAGLGGIVVPRAHGGLGHGLFAVARVCETLGRECASTAICVGMHYVATAVIAAKATPDHVERYLEPIAEGRHLTTLALSEPGTGSHFYIPQTTAVDSAGDAIVVEGTKTFVTNGGHADSYVISVAAGAEREPGSFSCVILPGGAEGLTWGEPWQGLGMRGNDSRSLTLESVRLDRRQLLGSHGDEIWYVFNVIAPYFLMAMAGTYLGVATAALEEARTHLLKRRYAAGGGALARQPVLQHRLGTMWSWLERTRRLVYHAAEAADAGRDDALPALCSAKAEVAECAVGIANEALTLAGGVAYRENSRLSRCLRDARAAHVMAPTTDILRTWTGRALLELPLLSD